MNRPQELRLERLLLTSYNNLDGPKVAHDLLKNQRLWDAFVFGRFEYGSLIELRDLPQGIINADTVYLLTTQDRLAALLSLTEQWEADEVGWQTADQTEGAFPDTSDCDLLGASLGPHDVLVRIWWD